MLGCFAFTFGRGGQVQGELVATWVNFHEAQLNKLLGRLVVRDARELPEPFVGVLGDLFESSDLGCGELCHEDRYEGEC